MQENNIYIEASLLEALDKIAKENGRERGSLIENTLWKYIVREESKVKKVK